MFDWSRGANDDREADGDRLDARDSDFEYSLGSAPGINQVRWNNGGFEDREQEHDGREPSLGSVAVDASSDQRRWSAGGDQGEREAVSEDEGAQQDAEPDRDGEGTCIPQWAIAGRRMSEVDGADAWRPLDPDEDPGEFVARCEVGLY